MEKRRLEKKKIAEAGGFQTETEAVGSNTGQRVKPEMLHPIFGLLLPLPTELPTSTPKKADYDLSSWHPATCMGDHNGALDS